MEVRERPSGVPGRRLLQVAFLDDRELIEVYSHEILRGRLEVAGDFTLKNGERTSIELLLPALEEGGVRLEGKVESVGGAGGAALVVEPLSEELKGYLESYITSVLRGEEPPPPDLEEKKERRHKPGVFYGGQSEQGEHAKPTFFRIKGMSVTEKIQVALKGSKAERSLLMKDNNPVIQQYVLKNPRISISEITELSRDLSLSAEAIRIISANRDWMANRTIRFNIVKNPKTPLPTVMKHLNSLGERELSQLAKSSSVRDKISRMALRLLQERGKTR